MMAFKSMELDDEQKLDAPMPIVMQSKPDFPCGLRISLTDAEIDKLEIDPADATAGGVFIIHALARITDVSERKDKDGKTCRIEAQIEAMCIDGDDDDDDDDDDKPKENKRARRSLYG